MHTASTITTTMRASTNVILKTTPTAIGRVVLSSACPSGGVADRDTLAPEFDREEELLILEIDSELCIEEVANSKVPVIILVTEVVNSKLLVNILVSEVINSKLLVNILVSEDNVREICGN